MFRCLSWLLEKKGLAAVDRKDRARDGRCRGEENHRARDVFGRDRAFERERGGNMLHAGVSELTRRKDRTWRDGVDADVRSKLAGEIERIAAERGLCGFVGRGWSGREECRGVQDIDGGKFAAVGPVRGEKTDKLNGGETVHGLLTVELGLRRVSADPHRGVVHERIDRTDGLRHAAHGVKVGDVAGNDFMMEWRGAGWQRCDEGFRILV